MGNSSVDSSSASSFSSSADGRGKRSRRSDGRRDHRRREKRNGKNDDHDHRDSARSTTTTPSLALALAAAPSDWDELRAHFQFVLPENNEGDYSNADNHKNDHYDGSTSWQERMVRHYHSHLYKEYVLADLSRVSDNIGKVGLRWRTEGEVADGRGFRCCGNLKCDGNSTAKGGGVADAEKKKEDYNYIAAAKRHMGIAVPENGGKEPIGVVLPASEETGRALESYLQSCAGERRSKDERGGKRKYHKKSKRRRSRKRGEEHEEQKRLSLLPFGIGLHDYEVDFVYAEQGSKKRELVKVRLCLRCAPLLFVAKTTNEGSSSHDNERGKEKRNIILSPAVRAREAREKAAMSHASSMANANNASSGNAKDGTEARDNANGSTGESGQRKNPGGYDGAGSDGSIRHL